MCGGGERPAKTVPSAPSLPVFLGAPLQVDETARVPWGTESQGGDMPIYMLCSGSHSGWKEATR